MLRTTPTSPLLVRKISSSTKPNRFTCEQSAAASRYSLVIRSSLNTAEPPHLHGLELHRVVLRANLLGVHQERQDLCVLPVRPSPQQLYPQYQPHNPDHP